MAKRNVRISGKICDLQAEFDKNLKLGVLKNLKTQEGIFWLYPYLCPPLNSMFILMIVYGIDSMPRKGIA